MFLKNRKGTKRETQTYKLRAWYLAGPVARDQERMGSWKQNNGVLETVFHGPIQLHPTQGCQQEGALAMESLSARVCAA